MGEQYSFPSPEFNKSIKLEARSERLTSDAGALVVREVAERLGLLAWFARRLDDPRRAGSTTHPLLELVMTYLVLQVLGWRDQDDADHLRHDPALQLAVSSRRGDAPLRHTADAQVPDGLASQPTLSRLLTTLSSEINRAVLANSLLVVAGRRLRARNGDHRLRHETVDIDALPIEVFGDQPGSEYNGHVGATVYHPLVGTLGSSRDLVGVMLRSGSASSADDAADFTIRLVEWARREIAQDVDVRFDAGFPSDPLLCALEQRRIDYLARIRNNPVLDRWAAQFLAEHYQPTAKRDGLWFAERTYQANSWSRSRRVVLVVQEQPGELLPQYFWLLTNLSQLRCPAPLLLQRYRARGNAEAAMGEWKSVLAPALSSVPRPKRCYRGRPLSKAAPMGPKTEDEELEPFRHAFAVNETILLLSALAYNLANVVRKELEAGTHEGWSISRTREQALKVGARVLLHGRRVVVAIADSAARCWEVLWYRLGHLRHSPAAFASN